MGARREYDPSSFGLAFGLILGISNKNSGRGSIASFGDACAEKDIGQISQRRRPQETAGSFRALRRVLLAGEWLGPCREAVQKGTRRIAVFERRPLPSPSRPRSRWVRAKVIDRGEIIAA